MVKKYISRREFLKKTGTTMLLGSMPFSLTGCNIGGNSQTEVEKSVLFLKKLSDDETVYDNYDLLKEIISEMVQAIYAKKSFFQYGDTVSIKVNLVGIDECLGMSAAQTYVTNPQVVKALGEVFLDFGAGQLAIIEGATSPSDTIEAYSSLGYDEIATYLGAELIDLNVPDPYGEFQHLLIEDGLVYDEIKAHHHLFETDYLVSAAKLKSHSMAGITLTLKNLIGLLPVSLYGLDGTGARIEYVHSPDPKTQIPYSIIDIARLFPIDFAFIDGVSAIDKGEGPWINDISFVQPGLLIASSNSLAADVVGCDVMGFDPKAIYPELPFINCYNHLELASSYNIGSIELENIEMVGDSVEDAVYEYSPPDPITQVYP